MKKILYISLVIMLYAVQPCLAQDIERLQETGIAGNDTAANVLPYAGDNALYLPGDTAFFPRLYNPMPYYTGSWQLHSGLNAQLGTSVTVGFGKHSPRGVGIGTHAAFLYAASLTPKLSLAGGISSETLDWGGIKLRNAELIGVAAYKVNDFMNVYAYGSKSLLDDKQRRIRPYPSFGRDRWGGAVDFSLGKNVFVQFGFEHASFY